MNDARAAAARNTRSAAAPEHLINAPNWNTAGTLPPSPKRTRRSGTDIPVPVGTGTGFKENKHEHRAIPRCRACQGSHIPRNLDLLSHSSLIFYQSGYSLHTLRQASRRSWRIGQRQPVRVYYLHYKETMQSSCLRLMARKMLVSLAMEGKFSGICLPA